MTPLLRSAPQRPVPKALLFGSMAALWGAPCVLGWMLAAFAMSTNGVMSAEAQLSLYGIVYLLIFSPIFSWVGWLLAAPLVWFLLRDGWFGWGNAGAVGLIVGMVASGLVGTTAAVPFAIIATLALRGVLEWKLKLGAIPG